MTKKSFSNWLLCIGVCFAILNLSSCKPPASGDQYKCYYPRTRGTANVVWQECTNNVVGSTKVSDKVTNLSDVCYVMIDIPVSENPDFANATECVVKPRKGSHPLLAFHSNLGAHYVGRQLENIRFVSKIDLLESMPHPDKKDHFIISKEKTYVYASMAFNYDPRYKEIYNLAPSECRTDAWDAYANECLTPETRKKTGLFIDDACEDFNYISNNCDYIPRNGGRLAHTCNIVACPDTLAKIEQFEPTTDHSGLMLGLTDPETDLADYYYSSTNPKIYPILSADSVHGGVDYYLNEATSDGKGGDVTAKRRFRYVYVHISIDKDLEHEYQAEIKYPDKSTNIVTFNSQNDVAIRYCQTNRFNERVYIVRFPLFKVGTHQLNLYDLTKDQTDPDKTKKTSLRTTTFRVDSREVGSNGKTYSNRTFELKPLSVRSTLVTPIINCKIACRNSLEETLTDAFSLNEKISLKAPIPKNEIQEGIKFKIWPACDIPLKPNMEPGEFRFFNSTGELLINAEKIQRTAASLPLLVAYNRELFRRYAQIADQYYNLACGVTKVKGDDYNKALIFNSYGFEPVDKDYKIIFPDIINSPYKSIGDPKIKLQGVLGLTGPSSSDDPTKNTTVVGVYSYNIFMAYSINMGGGSNPTEVENATAIVLAHELGHSWAQRDMVHKGPPLPILDGAHKAYCTGFNRDKCVFQSHQRPTIREFDEKGIIWCESHQQILLNQLARKPSKKME